MRIGRRHVTGAALVLVSLGAIALAMIHVAALTETFAGRFLYPYDLEWMEGGQLYHGYRVMHGQPLYGDCSDGWISFAYPPVHAWVLAIAGKIAGLDYPVGRAVSIGALCISGVLLLRESAGAGRSTLLSAALTIVPAGIIASTYQLVGGWYDVIRTDCIYMALTFGAAVASLPPLPRAGQAVRRGLSTPRIITCALLMTLAVLGKQTALLF